MTEEEWEEARKHDAERRQKREEWRKLQQNEKEIEDVLGNAEVSNDAI